jgi:hypothetical protein
MKKLKGAETTLEKEVQKTLNGMVYEGYEIESVLADLMQGGCQSGIIGGLIYYTDTVKFYKKHEDEINKLLKELCDDCGSTPAALFGDKWDAEDFFARDTHNQNLLAWFGFEETARNLASKNDIEL